MPQNIEPQTRELIEFAHKLGYDDSQLIVNQEVESGIKLTEEERLGLIKMKHYIETEDIDCVICWEPSRLARQQKTLFSIRDYLIERKIQLYILHPETKLLNDDGTLNATANIVFSLFATIAENEMNIKAERFKRAKHELREQGKKFSGAVIFGYMKNSEKRCVAHPIHGKIIQELFHHYAKGDSSFYETYMFGNSKWPDILPMEEYTKATHKIGHWFNKDIYYKGNWCYEPLITKEIWDKTHELMAKAKSRPRYECKRDLLCRGRIYCGECGRMMTGSGGRTNAYECSKDKLHSCQLGFKVADWLIWERTRDIINMNAVIDNRGKTKEIESMIDERLGKIRQYEDRLEKNKQKEEKLLDLYLNNGLNKEIYTQRATELTQSDDKLKNNINILNNEKSALEMTLNETQKDLMKPRYINVDLIEDFETRQEFVRRYIKKMIVKKIKPRCFNIEFEYMAPLILVRYGFYVEIHNKKALIWRINEDGTRDYIS